MSSSTMQGLWPTVLRLNSLLTLVLTKCVLILVPFKLCRCWGRRKKSFLWRQDEHVLDQAWHFAFSLRIFQTKRILNDAEFEEFNQSWQMHMLPACPRHAGTGTRWLRQLCMSIKGQILKVYNFALYILCVTTGLMNNVLIATSKAS